jgi:rare lipoprotein A
MAQGFRRWFQGAVCLAFLVGCAPHPVYNSRDGSPARRPSGGRVKTERSSDKSPATGKQSPPAAPTRTIPPSVNAHPLDPARIDTDKAYQVGVASYYGKKFHGRRTANGEIFNMYKLTAAHRVLPLGTRVRVTNLGNGRWVEVKVNDRGPFIEGRVLDLSFAAALELEMVKAGTARVMIEIVEAID